MKLLLLLRTCLLLLTFATAAALASAADPHASAGVPPTADLLAKLYPDHASFLEGASPATAQPNETAAARPLASLDRTDANEVFLVPATPSVPALFLQIAPNRRPVLPPSLEGTGQYLSLEETSRTLQALQELRPPAPVPAVPSLPSGRATVAMTHLSTATLTRPLDLPGFLAAALRGPLKYNPQRLPSVEAMARQINPDAVLINNAEIEEIARKLKIDARRARFIIEFRQAYGSFKHLEDLTQVNGISDSMLKAWEERELIVLE
jgi:competence ComEA-like helix-hairpin-helix protein